MKKKNPLFRKSIESEKRFIEVFNSVVNSFWSDTPLCCCTCAAIKSQLCGGVKFLDEELGQRYSVVRVQGFVAFLPVQHQVVICVGICWGNV